MKELKDYPSVPWVRLPRRTQACVQACAAAHVFEPAVVCAATLAAPMRAQLKATGPRADAPPASAPVILALAHLLFVVRAQDAVVE